MDGLVWTSFLQLEQRIRIFIQTEVPKTAMSIRNHWNRQERGNVTWGFCEEPSVMFSECKQVSSGSRLHCPPVVPTSNFLLRKYWLQQGTWLRNYNHYHNKITIYEQAMWLPRVSQKVVWFKDYIGARLLKNLGPWGRFFQFDIICTLKSNCRFHL